MTEPQWKRVLELYETTCTLSPDGAKCLLDASREEPAVLNEVRAMLAAEQQMASDADARTETEQGAYAGNTIGRYDVIARIGGGSHGEVYSGRDRELGRPVALKFISPEFVGSGSAAKRFIREAQAASALNHPNIVTVHEVMTWQSSPVIVMELVEGVSLRLICREPLPLARTIAIGRQIMDALAFAHANGFVHRDLKPENIMVRTDGYVKLLDLGLARRTMIPNATSTAGLPVGTLRYMSPEQCRGESATPPSDVFAAGIVFSEMLTGRHPFAADSPLETAHAIACSDPAPPSRDTAAVPQWADVLVERMLAKDAATRPSAAEIALALTDEGRRIGNVSHAPEAGSARGAAALLWPPQAKQPPPAAPAPKWRGWLLVACAAIIGLGVPGVLYFRHGKTPAPELRVEMMVPATDDSPSFALSPDGRRIAFVASDDGHRRLWVRALDSTSAQPLPGTEGASSPFWSPDSLSIGFFADLRLKRIDLGGAQPQNLATVPSAFAQGTWGATGVILFSWGVTPVHRVPAAGGQESIAGKFAKGQNNQFTPRFLPDGRRFLYINNGVEPSVWLGSLDGPAPLRIASVAVGVDSAAEYLAPDWLIRVRQGVLEAQHFDARLGRLSGAPVPLERSVGVDATNLAGSFSVASSGAVAWRSGVAGRRQMIWFNRSGQNLGAFGDIGDATLFIPEISPDGKRVATMRGPVGSSDIWVQEGIRNRRLTFGQGDNRYPIWSPDSVRIAFASNRNGAYDIYEKAADGSGDDQVLLQSPQLKRPNTWSPDGRFIIYWTEQNNGDLMVLPLAGDRKPFPFLTTPFNEQQAVFSPDGRWVAYQSDESGRFEVYARPFPGPGGQSQVSAGGGHSPCWRPDGKELYYLSRDWTLMAAKVTVEETGFATSAPEPLFETHINRATNRRQYDVARDGKFLIITDLPNTSTEPIHLLLNWQPAR
jgi:Tol biopolymer transport system component